MNEFPEPASLEPAIQALRAVGDFAEADIVTFDHLCSVLVDVYVGRPVFLPDAVAKPLRRALRAQHPDVYHLQNDLLDVRDVRFPPDDKGNYPSPFLMPFPEPASLEPAIQALRAVGDFAEADIVTFDHLCSVLVDVYVGRPVFLPDAVAKPLRRALRAQHPDVYHLQNDLLDVRDVRFPPDDKENYPSPFRMQ